MINFAGGWAAREMRKGYLRWGLFWGFAFEELACFFEIEKIAVYFKLIDACVVGDRDNAADGVTVLA